MKLGLFSRLWSFFRRLTENSWSGIQIHQKLAVSSVGRWRRLTKKAIEVNLDAPIEPPDEGSRVEWQPPAGRGWVRVERIGREIYVDGYKIVGHLEPEQMREPYLQGHILHERLKRMENLDPRILDALVEFRGGRLIPRSRKRKVDGYPTCYCAWAVGWRDSFNCLCIRYICCDGRPRKWRKGHFYLVAHATSRFPALKLV